MGALLAGCGNSSVSVGTDLGGAIPAPAQARPLGRVYLQKAVALAPITFRDLQGKVLGQATTTAEGEIPGQANLPSHFLIQVDLPDGEKLGAEVEGEARGVVVNVPTTLALLMHSRHQEWTRDEAAARVVRFLGAPPSCTPESLDNSRHGYFVVGTLLREAGPHGGLGAFLVKLAEQAETGRTHAFVEVPDGVIDFLSECAKVVAKDGLKGVLQAGAESAVGWVCESLGFNNPFPTMLDISNQIRALSDQITSLAASVARGNAQNDYNQAVARLASDAVEPIQLQSSTLATTIGNAVQANVTAPIPVNSVSSAVSAVVNSFNVFAARTAMNELSDNLLGTSAVGGVGRRLERLLTAVDGPPLGINSDLNIYMGYEAFTNSILSPRRSVLDYYLACFQQGANLDAEQLHLSQNSSILVANIRQGQADFRKWAQDRKSVQLQLPDPLPSDHVFLDRKNGLMWFTDRDGTNFHQRGHSDAVKEAQNFPGTGPYTSGWRLPTKHELMDLLYHAHIEPAYDAQQVADKERSQVLYRLGWDISYMDKDHTVWASDETAKVNLDNGKHENRVASFHNNDIVLVRSYPGPDDNFVTELGQVDPLSVRLEVLGSQVRALATVRAANGNGGTGNSAEIDVSGRVVWSSSDDSMASISNLPGSEGLITWHAQLNPRPLTPVTFSCQYFKPQGGLNFQVAQVASVVVQPPASPSLPHLSSIQPFPRNVEFNIPTPQTPVQQRFSAVLFYLDPASGDAQVQDFQEGSAPTITWTLTNRVNQPLAASENSGFTDGNLLVLSSDLRTSDLNVHARVGTVEAIVPIHCAVR